MDISVDCYDCFFESVNLQLRLLSTDDRQSAEIPLMTLANCSLSELWNPFYDSRALAANAFTKPRDRTTAEDKTEISPGGPAHDVGLSNWSTVLPYFPYVSLKAVWNVKKYGVPVDYLSSTGAAAPYASKGS